MGTRGPSETKPLDVYFLNLYVNPFAISPRISKWKVKPWLQVLEQHNFYREKIKEKNLKAVKRKLSETEQDDPHRLDADLDEMLRGKKSYCQEVSSKIEN